MLVFEFDLPFDFTVDLFAVFDIAAAVSVTGHALLRKRDVRGAIGWIGLAWLSPIIGPALYYLFGINRVTRRAERLRAHAGSRRPPSPNSVPPQNGVRLPENILAIAQVGDRLTAHPLVDGNAISIYVSGDEAYPAMLEAIGRARRSIALCSYIFRADSIGIAFIEALDEARQRGVEIRVLVDAIGSGYLSCPVLRELRQSGVPASRFLHDWRPWRMPFLNMRNHKKLLIVDGETGFTGGLNLGTEI